MSCYHKNSLWEVVLGSELVLYPLRQIPQEHLSWLYNLILQLFAPVWTESAPLGAHS